jgi:hypothetical protein
VQDTIVVIPPYPYSITEDIDNVPFKDCWYALPQLFLQRHLRSTGGQQHKNLLYKIGPDDLLFNLIFFSTFEELNLPIHGPMEDSEVIKLYEPGPIPCLYVAPVYHMVGRVPLNEALIPLFLAGNSTPSIPHKFSKHKGSGFPMGCADSAASDGSRGSRVFEVNTWLWNFGCGKPRLSGLTVEEIAMRKETVRQDQAKRSAETRRRRQGGWTERDPMKFAVDVCTCTYLHVPVCTSLYHELTKLERF